MAAPAPGSRLPPCAGRAPRARPHGSLAARRAPARSVPRPRHVLHEADADPRERPGVTSSPTRTRLALCVSDDTTSDAGFRALTLTSRAAAPGPAGLSRRGCPAGCRLPARGRQAALGPVHRAVDTETAGPKRRAGEDEPGKTWRRAERGEAPAIPTEREAARLSRLARGAPGPSHSAAPCAPHPPVLRALLQPTVGCGGRGGGGGRPGRRPAQHWLPHSSSCKSFLPSARCPFGAASKCVSPKLSPPAFPLSPQLLCCLQLLARGRHAAARTRDRQVAAAPWVPGGWFPPENRTLLLVRPGVPRSANAMPSRTSRRLTRAQCQPARGA